MSEEPEKLVEGTLISHLLELRDRLIRAIIAVAVAFLPCMFYSNQIFTFVATPLKEKLPKGTQLIATTVMSPFTTPFKLSLFVALFLAMPVVIYQLWAFVAPGLYRHEKRAFRPFLVATPFMFYLGCAVMYYVVMPYVLNFMLALYNPPTVETTLRASDYLERVLQLVFAFGFAFEIPVLLVLLVRVGIVSTAGLRSKRRFAIVIAFLIAAVLTPPDIVSQFALALPLIGFYEISIVIGRLIEKKRAEEEKAADAASSSS